MFPYLVGLPLHVKYALCPAKQPTSLVLVYRRVGAYINRLKLFPQKHVRKTLASILSEKATAIIKRVKDYEHTSQCVNQRKRRAGNLSRFPSTKPVIFKPVISGSNMVEFTPNLVISFFA